MTIDQVEGNEPIHENFGTQLGDEIDEVRTLLSLLYVTVAVIGSSAL
jgi:hypothetical protein